MFANNQLGTIFHSHLYSFIISSINIYIYNYHITYNLLSSQLRWGQPFSLLTNITGPHRANGIPTFNFFHLQTIHDPFTTRTKDRAVEPAILSWLQEKKGIRQPFSCWWLQPLKNMSLSVGTMTFPTEWKNQIHVPNHQPDLLYIYMIIHNP